MVYLVEMRLALAAAASLSVGFVTVAAGTAEAGPTTRFGLTGALKDQSAPEQHELGPMFAIGERIGPLTIEADYAYLSFLDPETGKNGMQRLGLNLRGDILRTNNYHCYRFMACTRGSAIFAEAGIAERYGIWHLDANSTYPAHGDTSKEMHFGVGLELDNRVAPYRYGWQFGIRFAVAPHDTFFDTAARTSSPTQPSQMKGVDRAVLIEWTFLVGR